MTRSRIQVVFFDAADTLFHIHGSVAEIYLQHAEKHGFRKTPESLTAIKSAFARSFRDAPPPVFAAREPAAIKQSERLWWFDIVHNVFYRVGMFEAFDEFFEDVFARFEQPESWRLFPETLAVLKTLKGQGFELGIISNADVHYVVTEFGVAALYGKSIRQRTRQLMAVAHPDFRRDLEKQATDLQYI